jgi:hypothetical protein
MGGISENPWSCSTRSLVASNASAGLATKCGISFLFGAATESVCHARKTFYASGKEIGTHIRATYHTSAHYPVIEVRSSGCALAEGDHGFWLALSIGAAPPAGAPFFSVHPVGGEEPSSTAPFFSRGTATLGFPGTGI